MFTSPYPLQRGNKVELTSALTAYLFYKLKASTFTRCKADLYGCAVWYAFGWFGWDYAAGT
jgi:hypothetical protein